MPKLKILNETPLEFQEKFLFDEWEVSYLDLMEVNQGSPLVGSLSVNGQVIIQEQGLEGLCCISIEKYIFQFSLDDFGLLDLGLQY